MRIVHWLRRTAAWLLHLRRFGSRWAKPLADNAIWHLDGASIEGRAGLKVSALGLVFERPDPVSLMLLRARRYGAGLHERAGASFEVKADRLGVTVDGVRLEAYCDADIGVLHEVFVERLYAFEMAGRFLIVDIGTNIGASALFFARHYDAEVVGFELVPSTAEIAAKNLELNPELRARITLNRFGLADSDMETEVPVSIAFRPSNSLYVATEGKEGTKERVEVRDAATVFETLLADLGDRKLVVKLDAEGAEYEILGRLAESKMLGRADLLYLEWHRREGKDPEKLRGLLRKAGFQWFEREHVDAPVGMIEAWRES